MTWDRFRPSSLIFQIALRSAVSSASARLTANSPRTRPDRIGFLPIERLRSTAFTTKTPGRGTVTSFALKRPVGKALVGEKGDCPRISASLLLLNLFPLAGSDKIQCGTGL